MLSSVAPAPISMSSEWAPRQRTDNRSPADANCNAFMMSSSRVLFVPRGAPWHLASFDHFFEYLPIFQHIHGPPEALVFVSEELAIFDQAIEGIENQFLAVQA